MNLDPSKEVKCYRCLYEGPLSKFKSAVSVYNDAICPNCQSSNNSHNKEYKRELFRNIEKFEKEMKIQFPGYKKENL